MKLEDFLQANYGYNPAVKNAIKGYIDLWKQLYEGNVKKTQGFDRQAAPL